MSMKHVVRALGVRRRTIAILVGVITPLAVLAPASAALAENHPTGEFEKFKQCPLATAGLNDCVFAETNGGKFTVGKRTVPINKTILLQGGFIEETSGLKFVGAENGETLTKVPLTVPGGIFNIVAPEYLPKFLQEIFNDFVNEGITGVTATTELAAPASDIGISTENLIEERGTALSLPVKIKLDNAFVGESCFVGSNSAPIVIEFTSGTTKPPAGVEPLKGSAGTFEANKAFTLITLKGGKLVNNTFKAPGAEGCGGILSFLIDPAVDAALGLPSGEGANAAILEGNLSTGNAAAVKASE